LKFVHLRLIETLEVLFKDDSVSMPDNERMGDDLMLQTIEFIAVSVEKIR